jgi:tetratricopeptide (TPR) repeat protein
MVRADAVGRDRASAVRYSASVTRDRRTAVALAVILAVGLALRVAYILGQRGDLLFDYPVVDEERYIAMGRALADGQVPDPRPWFHPPGVVYALAAVFWTCGPELLVPRLVQAIVSTASCGLAFVVARRFFSPGVALAAAAVCAAHGVLVFESYELLPPTWMLAADLLALELLLRAGDERTPQSALLAGVAFGVAALFGPTVLPFALFAAAWLRRPVLAAALVVGVTLPIAPVTWGNWQRGHEVVLVSTNGGINFFLGNNERYDETLSIRPGPHWDELRDAPKRARSSESGYYTRAGLTFWRDHPAQATALYGRKLYLYLDGPEIPRDTDLQAMRRGSTLLSALVSRGPPYLPDGVLVPLALVGAVVLWRERRRLALPYLFVALQVLVVALFFVTSRYRVPAIPVLAMFAAAGAVRAVEWWRAAAIVPRALSGAAFVVLAIVLNVPTRESSASYAAELDFYRGLASRTYVHSPKKAIDYFRRATEEDPRDARFWLELGDTLSSEGRQDQAIEAWRRAGDADPWDERSRRKLGSALERRGDLEGAIAALQGDVDAHAHPQQSFYASDHMKLALLCARAGIEPRAAEELRTARQADLGQFRMNVAAFTKTALGSVAVPAAAFWEELAAADDDIGARDLAAQARARIAMP